MAIDPRIALGVEHPQIANALLQTNPLDTFSKGLQIRNALTEGRMGDLKLQGARRDATDQDKLRALFQDPAYLQADDPTKQQMLTRQGPAALPFLKAGLEIENTRAQIGKNQEQARKAAYETQSAKINDMFHAAATADSPEELAQSLQAGVQQGRWKQEEVQPLVAMYVSKSLPSDPKSWEGLKRKLLMQTVGGADQLKIGLRQDEFAYRQKNDAATRAQSERVSLRADARARERQATDDRQVEYVADPSGNFVALPKKVNVNQPIALIAVMGRDGQPIANVKSAGYEAKQLNQRLMTSIQAARELIPKATASGVGAAVDTTMGFFGQSNAGADAASQLDTIAGWMTSNVPRMQGPQSDKDTILYKQMAAQVGDRHKLASQRLKALDTLEQLQQKYGVINSGGRAPGGGAPRSDGRPPLSSFGSR